MNTTYKIQAQNNTWSHSRKKRRELARSVISSHEMVNRNQDAAAKELYLVNRMESNEVLSCFDGESSGKRKCESSTQDLKRIKIEEKDIFLKCTISICVDSELIIEVNYLHGLGGKDACHQILQYLKNHLKFPHCI
ncbi:hypothetical protein AMK59_7064 [Oryctes borbonicus]|uniref:Uncharacterized protein n=1 Tax=Oryctes borbonicus TaxID=1629725 RepID=A0A0T6AVC0_9SCAR|nr:hypothetical protein AMK59_7064 [Oryctes borbonicus]